jgi:hypothetical protein
MRVSMCALSLILAMVGRSLIPNAGPMIVESCFPLTLNFATFSADEGLYPL